MQTCVRSPSPSTQALGTFSSAQKHTRVFLFAARQSITAKHTQLRITYSICITFFFVISSASFQCYYNIIWFFFFTRFENNWRTMKKKRGRRRMARAAKLLLILFHFISIIIIIFLMFRHCGSKAECIFFRFSRVRCCPRLGVFSLSPSLGSSVSHIFAGDVQQQREKTCTFFVVVAILKLARVHCISIVTNEKILINILLTRFFCEAHDDPPKSYHVCCAAFCLFVYLFTFLPCVSYNIY